MKGLKLKYCLLFLILINFNGFGKVNEKIESETLCKTVDSVFEKTVTIFTRYGEVKIRKKCNKDTSYMSISCFLKNINDEVYDEADKSKIQKDKAIMSFKINSNCEITNFTFIKKGSLKSFNDLVEKFCGEIIIELNKRKENVFEDCSTKKCGGNFMLPIYLTIY